MKKMEIALIDAVRKSLRKHKGKRKKACEELGISERTLSNYLIKYPQLRKFVTRRKENLAPMWKRYPDKDGEW